VLFPRFHDVADYSAHYFFGFFAHFLRLRRLRHHTPDHDLFSRQERLIGGPKRFQELSCLFTTAVWAAMGHCRSYNFATDRDVHGPSMCRS
jgi:hypothetical protein